MGADEQSGVEVGSASPRGPPPPPPVAPPPKDLRKRAISMVDSKDSVDNYISDDEYYKNGESRRGSMDTLTSGMNIAPSVSTISFGNKSAFHSPGVTVPPPPLPPALPVLPPPPLPPH
mgnify:FL=1